MSIKDAKFIPGTNGAYALSNNGSISLFHHTSNPFAAPVTWNDTELDGVYSRIVSELNGLNVYAYGTNNSANLPAGQWSVIFLGTEINRSVDGFGRPYIDVAAEFHGDFGGYGIFLSTNETDTCCLVSEILILSGSQDLGGAGWWECGETPPSSVGDIPPHTNGFISPPPNPINTIRLLSTSPISYRVYFDTDCASGGSNAVVTQYSVNSGDSFAPLKIVGVLPSGGMDTIKIGDVALAAAGSQVFKATSGGAWSIYSGTLPTGSRPDAIFIPRWQFGGTVTPNINTSSPQYLLGSGTLSASGDSLWKVIGGTFTAISPKIGGTAGIIVSPESVKMPWNSGTDILAIANFSGAVKLCVSNNTGGLWKFTDLNSGADAVAMRRGDTQNKQAMLTNQSVAGLINSYQSGTVIDYDRNHLGNATQSIDVYG